MASIIKEPQSPFPNQHQEKPGIESELDPRPRYRAPKYQSAAKLKDKVALITGGDSGIGRAVAVMYAREGADVAVVYLPVEQSDAEETRKAVEAAGRRALLLPGDVSDPAFCRSAVQQTIDEYGKLDILVNNAAYLVSTPGPARRSFTRIPLNPSDNKTPKEVAELGSGTPMERPAQPEEIAPAFVFFASEADSS